MAAPCRGRKAVPDDSAQSRAQLCSCAPALLMSSAPNFHALLPQGMEGQRQSKRQVSSQRLHMTDKRKNLISSCHGSLEFSSCHGACSGVIHQPGIPAEVAKLQRMRSWKEPWLRGGCNQEPSGITVLPASWIQTCLECSYHACRK